MLIGEFSPWEFYQCWMTPTFHKSIRGPGFLPIASLRLMIVSLSVADWRRHRMVSS